MLKRSAELQRMELAAKESIRLGVPVEQLKNLLHPKAIDGAVDALDTLPSSKDILLTDCIYEHPMEEFIRRLDDTVGMTLAQLTEISKMSRTEPPQPKDIADFGDEFSEELAERLGVSVELYKLLSRGNASDGDEEDSMDDLHMPRSRP